MKESVNLPDMWKRHICFLCVADIHISDRASPPGGGHSAGYHAANHHQVRTPTTIVTTSFGGTAASSSTTDTPHRRSSGLLAVNADRFAMVLEEATVQRKESSLVSIAEISLNETKGGLRI